MFHRLAKLIAALLPLLCLGGVTGGTITGGSIPAPSGALSTVWATSWEAASGCTGNADNGNPDGSTTVSCGNDANPDYTVETYEGSHSLWLGDDSDSDTIIMGTAWTDVDDLWVRMFVQIDTSGTGTAQFWTTNADNNNFKLDVLSDDTLLMSCPSNSDGGASNALSVGTWYIVQMGFFDDGSNVGSGELELWSTAATPVQDGSQIDCTGDDAEDETMTGFRSSVLSGAGAELLIDCIEVYTSDPGDPTVNTCHANAQGE